mgnify:FL=1
MRATYTVLASLLFLPLTILGQTAGLLGGRFLYWIYTDWMFLDMPSITLKASPIIISGFVGGLFSAWGCAKLYKCYHPTVIMIFPAAVTISFVVLGVYNLPGKDYNPVAIAQLVAHLLNIGIFYSALKNQYPPIKPEQA